MRIGSGHERGDIYYLDDRVTPMGLVAGQPHPVLLWYWHLRFNLLFLLSHLCLL